MTAIGLAHYGGTLGLYNEPHDEISRALAYYSHLDDLKLADERARRKAS